MPKKGGSLHNRIAARGEQYNQPAGLSFNLDFGSKLLRVKGFVSGDGLMMRGLSHVLRKRSGLRGYPAWIRTKNNASKGRCVTWVEQFI